MRAERITTSATTAIFWQKPRHKTSLNKSKQFSQRYHRFYSNLHTDYIESTAGSISQIRETTAELIKFAKETNIPVILIGHITKDGTIAGPKILEHMVDTVLQLRAIEIMFTDFTS
jgi:DNA repair protein RadA/Sms